MNLVEAARPRDQTHREQGIVSHLVHAFFFDSFQFFEVNLFPNELLSEFSFCHSTLTRPRLTFLFRKTEKPCLKNCYSSSRVKKFLFSRIFAYYAYENPNKRTNRIVDLRRYFFLVSYSIFSLFIYNFLPYFSMFILSLPRSA